MRIAVGSVILLHLCSCGGEHRGEASDKSTDGGSAVANQPVVLASAQSKPWTIAIDNDNVYWISSGIGGVYKVSKSGGTPTSLYEGVMGNVESFGLDGTSVYFPIENAILAVPLGGGAPRTVAPAERVLSLAVANNEVYWVEPSGVNLHLSVKKIAVSGGTPTAVELPQVRSPGGARAISGPDGVYVGFSGRAIVRIPFNGPATLLGDQEARALAVDRDSVYFATIESVAVIPTAGGTARTLVSARDVFGIAVDDTFVYFGESSTPGRLLKVPKSGGEAVEIAAGVARPHSLAVDASNVYWNSIDEGTVKKLAK